MNFNDPVFITGCTNSGTTILFRALLDHPDLSGFPNELRTYGICPDSFYTNIRLHSLYPSFRKYYADSVIRNDRQVGPVMTEETIERLKAAESQAKYEQRKYLKDERHRLIFKEPRLALRIKWIKAVFPSAFIIHLIRDPFAVVEGIKRKTADDVDTPSAVSQWLSANSIVEVDSKGVDRFIAVRYEDLIEDETAFFQKILSFLELDSSGFEVPVYRKNDNSKCMERLSTWDKELIEIMTTGVREKYGY